MKHAQKKELIGKYARSSSDTGSPEVQIALLTARIDALTEHLGIHKKDNHSRRGLLGLVQKRRQLKNYLQKTNPEAAKKIADELDAIKGEKKAKIVSNAAIAAAKSKKTKATKEKSEDSSTEEVSEKKPKAAKTSSAKKAPAKKTSKKK